MSIMILQQQQEQEKKKKAKAMVKRKVTRSSSLSSEASDQSSSDSDSGQSSKAGAASESANTSDDSDSESEVTLKTNNKSQISKKKVESKKTTAQATKKSKAKITSRALISSEDESMALSSTAASSTAVSPNKSSVKGNKKPAGGARPNTRQRGGSHVKRSRHVTGKHHSALIDTDSDVDMTSTANESVASSPRKKSGRGRQQKNTRKDIGKIKTPSFSGGEDSQGEEISKKKPTSVSAKSITDRLLSSRHFDRQGSSPSGEGFNTNNRSSNSFSSNGHLTGGGPAHSVVTLPPVRRTFEGCTSIEERKCPTPGCDSLGHLSGSAKFDRHFTQEACPMYHNLVKKECRDFRSEINKKQSARRKAFNTMEGARSPLGSPSSDQKRHSQIVSL